MFYSSSSVAPVFPPQRLRLTVTAPTNGSFLGHLEGHPETAIDLVNEAISTRHSDRCGHCGEPAGCGSLSEDCAPSVWAFFTAGEDRRDDRAPGAHLWLSLAFNLIVPEFRVNECEDKGTPPDQQWLFQFCISEVDWARKTRTGPVAFQNCVKQF